MQTVGILFGIAAIILAIAFGVAKIIREVERRWL